MSSPGPDLAPPRRACVCCGREFLEEITRCPDDGTLLTPLADQPVIGAVLGDRYEITGVIAGGGMGTIFRAKHQLMKRTVAIKMLHPQLVSSAGTLKRFQQEAEAASCLNHPNILTVFDFGLSAQGKPYLVMDLLEGKTLASLLEAEGHLPAARSLRIFVQMTAALAHAHQKSIIHRDLKPANIMLVDLDGDPDFVKLVDFGIAKMLSPEAGEGANLTKTGEVFGSPLYMSPEQCLGNPIDPRTDIYSLGCVMYRTLTGVTPAEGTDLLELMYKHANITPADFASACPELGLSPELESVVFKAMSKTPDERFQSMEELRAALESLPEFKDVGPLPAAGARLTSEISLAGSSLRDVNTDSQVTLAAVDEPTVSAKPLADGTPQAGVEPVHPLALARQLLGQHLPTARRALLKYRWIAIFSLVLMVLGAALLLRADSDQGRRKEVNSQANQTATGVNGSADTGTASKGSRSGSLSDEFDQLMKKGQAAYGSGNYLEAEKDFQEAYDIAVNFGQWDPRFATSLAWEAKVYIAQGRYAEATTALGWVLGFQRRRYGYNSPQVTETLMQLSTLAKQQGDLRQAKRLLKQAEAIRSKTASTKQEPRK